MGKPASGRPSHAPPLAPPRRRASPGPRRARSCPASGSAPGRVAGVEVSGHSQAYTRVEGTPHPHCSSLPALQNPVTQTTVSSVVVASTFETIVHHLNLSFLHSGCKLVLI
ncbi:hypothetical protein LEMLEM_LOCUS26693 [Lemmus lemmus]